MPRIMRYGESGPKEMKLSPEVIKKYRENIPEGMTIKDGDVYKLESFRFTYNATLVRTFFGEGLSRILSSTGMKYNKGIISLFILTGFFIFMLIWQLYYRARIYAFTEIQEVLYWQIVLIIILLSGPLTWVMSLVWLLPIIVILLYEYILIKNKAISLYLCAMALVVAALPDHLFFSHFIPVGEKFIITHRYLFAEVLLLVSLVVMLNRKINKRSAHLEKI
jgi:hypothetical protein